MTTTTRLTLDEYLALEYPFNAIADPDGGWVIEFPDLPGCLSQADTPDEIGSMAEEARRVWIKTTYADNGDIPLPSYPEEYSGKFNVRLPRSLHRRLAEGAAREGVSLNQYLSSLVATNDALRGVERRIDDLATSVEKRLERLEARLDDIHPSTNVETVGIEQVRTITFVSIGGREESIAA